MLLPIIAICLSVITLSWNIASTIYRYPRVSVLLNRFEHISSDDDEPDMFEIQVIVINTGSEAVTISDVRLSEPPIGVYWPTSNRSASGGTTRGASLPARLDAHDSRTWAFEYEDRDDMPLLSEVQGIVERFRPERILGMRRNPIKRYRSVRVSERARVNRTGL